MKPDLHPDVEGRRLQFLVPRPFRKLCEGRLRRDALYTAVIFSPQARAPATATEVMAALKQVGEPGSILLVIAAALTDEARELIAGQAGIALTPEPTGNARKTAR